MIDERERQYLENAKGRVLDMIAQPERELCDDEMYVLDALNAVLLGVDSGTPL